MTGRSRPCRHERPRRASIGLAIVRVIVEESSPPVIRVLRIDDLLRDEYVLGVSSNPEEAAAMIWDWLVGIVERAEPTSPSRDDPVTRT